MPNPPLKIFLDPSKLADWIAHNPSVAPDGGGIELESPNYAGAKLRQTSFSRSTLRQPDFSGADLTGVNFDGATLSGGSWAGAVLADARFIGASLEGLSLEGAKALRDRSFRSAKLSGVSMRGADLQGADFSSARLTNADFRGARLGKASFAGAALSGCDFRGARLYGAELTHSTWRGCRVDGDTVLTASVWRRDHDSSNDGTEELDLPIYRRVLNWEAIRIVGRMPLFSGAYVLLTVALLLGTGIIWANGWIQRSGIATAPDFFFPFPPRLLALLVGSAALAIGATVFELACPPRVKEFSRTGWAEELRRPGLLYVVDTLQRPVWNAFAFAFTGVGALILGGLFIERLVRTVILIAAAT